MGGNFDSAGIQDFNEVALFEGLVCLAPDAYDNFGFRNMDNRLLLLARADGEEPGILLDGIKCVNLGGENLVVAVENLWSRTLFVEVGISLFFLLVLFVLFAQVPEHVLEIAIAGVPFIATDGGNSLRQVGIGDSGFARSRFREAVTFIDAVPQVNGVARINPVRVFNVPVVFPEVRPSERIV